MKLGTKILCRRGLVSLFAIRPLSSIVTNVSARHKRSELFSEEKRRQAALVSRVEKIEVRYRGLPDDTILMMNRHLSTPYNCAMHMHEVLCQRSVLALVDGRPFDMHRPLESNCEVRLLNFHSREPGHLRLLNKSFWRSCSFLLGMVAERSFRDDLFVRLHSWPRPRVESGSYVYDVDVPVTWSPTPQELQALSVQLWRLSADAIPFERLQVSEDKALEMFEDNELKLQQIPHLAKEGQVTLYRVSDHVDISCGPMMASTGFLGTTQVTAVHPLEKGFRFQAVSLPKQLTLSAFAFSLLAERAKALNHTGLETETEIEDEREAAAEPEVKDTAVL